MYNIPQCNRRVADKGNVSSCTYMDPLTSEAMSNTCIAPDAQLLPQLRQETHLARWTQTLHQLGHPTCSPSGLQCLIPAKMQMLEEVAVRLSCIPPNSQCSLVLLQEFSELHQCSRCLCSDGLYSHSKVPACIDGSSYLGTQCKLPYLLK